MDFTYSEYELILNKLKEKGYVFSKYYSAENEKNRNVILRHDVDISLKKAYEMAQLEHSNNVVSTYFVLITGDFYNAFNKESQYYIKKISQLGHDIGLHFDETIYGDKCDVVKKIENEINVMENMLDGVQIKSVSMHIPSKRTLDSNYVIKEGNIINSYSDFFFQKYKYVSDSKMHWREDIYDVIESEMYNRIHLLTHPVWYNDVSFNMWENVSKVMCQLARTAYSDFDVHTVGEPNPKSLKECLGEIYDKN